MRVFVVLASIVALASADVKHLYDAPYNKEASVPSSGYSYSGPNGNGGHSTYGPVSSGSGNNFVNSGPVSSGFGPNNGNSGFGPVSNGNNGFNPGNSGFVNGPISTGPSNSGFGPVTNGQGNNGFVNGPISSGPISSGFGPGSSGNSGFGPVTGGAVNRGNFHDTDGVKTNFQTKLVKQTVPLVSKSSYVYSAPEDLEDIQREQTIVLPRPRQHYKVVFIKAPSTTIVNSPSTGTGGQVQEKTLIYVLSDKKRIENHIDVPEDLQSKPQKPEVFFVKYNKPTEVVNSQIKYETVDAVNGAENGAINGVPNKVTNKGPLQDEVSTPEQNQIAQTIHEALQNGGLQNGINTVDRLISQGHPISGVGSTIPSRGQFDNTASGQSPSSAFSPSGASSVKPVSSGSSNSAINGASYPEQGYVY